MNLLLYIHGKGGSAAESEQNTNFWAWTTKLSRHGNMEKLIRDMMSWAKFSEVFIFICTYNIIKNHRLS